MRSRIGPKVLGLCALLIGVMAIDVGSAQALPEWMNKSATLVGEPEVLLEKDSPVLTLLTKINKIDIDLKCTASVFVGNIKLQKTGLTSSGKVKFTGCSVVELALNAKEEVTGETTIACHVKSAGTAEGEIVTRAVKGVLGLSAASVPIVKIIPISGETFVEIETSKCVLPELIPVIGKLTAKDCNNLAETEAAKHLFEEGPESELFIINKTEMEHLSMLDGSIWVKLTEANKTFSGLAG